LKNQAFYTCVAGIKKALFLQVWSPGKQSFLSNRKGETPLLKTILSIAIFTLPVKASGFLRTGETIAKYSNNNRFVRKRLLRTKKM
jgi:hypothetical protein